MTITYADGAVQEAVLLSLNDGKMRAAIDGAEDAAEFVNVNGAWISDDCEVVRVEFSWERIGRRSEKVSEEDCICSPELAAKLIHLLWNGSAEQSSKMYIPAPGLARAASLHVM